MNENPLCHFKIKPVFNYQSYLLEKNNNMCTYIETEMLKLFPHFAVDNGKPENEHVLNKFVLVSISELLSNYYVITRIK